ncbi:metal-dependent hydrolase [Nitrosomonas sp. JL21]|uniref:metal-dependent hydrolase n=1 Tax=Nitrosomonas sp. JL21 TaxID=153949 RepID=UPI001368B671|nr:metal-dependent hydrolase [Nitrosomonas sp.]MCC7091213.1 metal-dependent hydrolase [Nitrosomonas sp.]MXS78216.1 metal-dependent hydrolase [Nitrosomonas sp. JL21]
MDPLTHALSGALLARAAARPAPCPRSQQAVLPLRLQIMASLVAAAFPDIDLILRWINTLTYLNWHQGPTHSVILLPFWAWLLAWLFSRLVRKHYTWQSFYLPACLGIAIHIAGDLITSYGLMLLAPFSTARYSVPLAFVIDPWFTLIILIGLAASWRYRRWRLPAILALVGLCGYVFFLWTLQQQATALAQNYIHSKNLHSVQISVLPQPLSPFHWKLIIRQHDRYHVADMNLRQSRNELRRETDGWWLPNMAAAYHPSGENNWRIRTQFGTDSADAALIEEAWFSPAFAPFRSFAQFPVLDRMDHSQHGHCAWFYDLRFEFPLLPPSFRYGACRKTGASDWEIVRERGVFYID